MPILHETSWPVLLTSGRALGSGQPRTRAFLAVLALVLTRCGDGDATRASAPRRPGATAAEPAPASSGASGGAATVSAPGAGQEPERPGPAQNAVLISVDGLAPRYLEELLEAGALPTFRVLQAKGAWTHNARANYGSTVTLPNHTSMITGRPAAAAPELPVTAHHGYLSNSFPGPEATLHNSGNPALDYIPSLFDVAHDRGHSTCLFSAKEKFVLFETSYDWLHGAADRVGGDDGPGKLDYSMIGSESSEPLVETFVDLLFAERCDLTLFHFAETDRIGHAEGWGSDSWLSALTQIDGWLARIVEALVQQQAAGRDFALIVTADHGGAGFGHSAAQAPEDYTIPFYLLGAGVPGGTDLYAWLDGKRAEPGGERPNYAGPQPIRNGDAANALLGMMRLPEIPGSFMRNFRD